MSLHISNRYQQCSFCTMPAKWTLNDMEHPDQTHYCGSDHESVFCQTKLNNENALKQHEYSED